VTWERVEAVIPTASRGERENPHRCGLRALLLEGAMIASGKEFEERGARTSLSEKHFGALNVSE
jgi:hypothetical protein